MVNPGDVVGRYRLHSRLGSGGTGTVWQAEGPDGEPVAIKMLHPGIAADPAARARLQREVTALERLRGTRVAQVLDAHITPDLCFIVTTLVDGLSLEQSVDQEGAFSPVDLYPLAEGLVRAITEVHGVGLVHRDIKPGNVMVTYQGPMLIDFGIAQSLEDARLTHTGFVTGTPGYIDPTALGGGEVGQDGDWYGLAAVLLYAATGRPPFGSGRLDIVLSRMASDQPDTDGLDPRVAAAFRAALAYDASRRVQPQFLLEVLQAHADGRPIPLPPPSATTSVPQPSTRAVLPPSFPPTAPAPSAPAPPMTAPPLHAPPAQPYPSSEVRPPQPRPALSLTLGAVLCAVAYSRPGVALIAAAGLFWALSSVGMAWQRVLDRRRVAGRRRRDPWVGAWTSLTLAIPAAVASLVPILLGGIAAAVVWWLSTRLAVTEMGVPTVSTEVGTALALGVGMAVAWWVPTSTSARLGARVMWSGLAPTALASRVWCAAGWIAVLILVLTASGMDWSPFPAPSAGA